MVQEGADDKELLQQDLARGDRRLRHLEHQASAVDQVAAEEAKPLLDFPRETGLAGWGGLEIVQAR